MDGSTEPVGKKAAGIADDLTRDLEEMGGIVGRELVISPSRSQAMARPSRRPGG